jgi:hypothetical protein
LDDPMPQGVKFLNVQAMGRFGRGGLGDNHSLMHNFLKPFPAGGG